MGEEGEEEVGKKKRRSARILELEGEKKKKIKDKKEVKEQGEGSTNKLKVKSKSEVEEGPKQDHEEHEEEQEKTKEEQNPSTREAVEAPTVNEETLEDVDVAFVASPSQQDIMDASQPDHTDSDQQPTDPSMHTPLPAQSSAPSELSVDTLTTSETST
ncbi:hypothetical protein ACJW30_08G097100 [Castanea mollissima]